MSLKYGSDTSTLAGATKDQLDTTFNIISDPYDVLLEEVYRRLTTAPGFTDPYYGLFWDSQTIDLRKFVNASLTQSELANIKNQIESVFQDELRYDVSVTVTISGSGILQLIVGVEIFPSTDTRPIVVTFIVGTDRVDFVRA